MQYVQSSVPDQEVQSSPPDDRPAVVKPIFRNRFGHWRAGWRVVVYLIAVFVISKMITTPLKLFAPGVPESDFLSWTHTLVWVVGNAALILGGLVVLRFFDRRPVALLGVGFSRGWLLELVGGFGELEAKKRPRPGETPTLGVALRLTNSTAGIVLSPGPTSAILRPA